MTIISVLFKDEAVVQFHFKYVDDAINFRVEIRDDSRVETVGMFDGAAIYQTSSEALRAFEKTADAHPLKS